MAELTTSRIDVDKFLKKAFNPEAGAVALFLGVVRNHNEGKKVVKLEYEAYEPLALKAMSDIESELREKYSLKYINIIHRTGSLPVGEISLLVVASAPHRKEALSAVEEAINLVKKRVPVWKKEFFEDGSVTWVKGEQLEGSS